MTGPAAVVPESDVASLAWLGEFERRHGRPLRVLHIGNIANNAYNNAKIQRARGIVADVSCHDYYHVMGTPEWEDADFEGDVGDPFLPDWWAVDLRGWTRPRWFAQGRLVTCQRYLRAVRRGRRASSALLWRQLEAERWLLCRRTRRARVAGVLFRIAHRLFRIARRLIRLPFGIARRLVRLSQQERDGRIAQELTIGAAAEDGRRSDAPPAATLPGLPVEALARRFRELFPERAGFTAEDVAPYAPAIPAWRNLLEEYDIVQGYSTDPIIPLLCETPAYTAYEHGTLRAIPFEEGSRGRICALAYREAAAVFVTNSDVLPSVERLGLAPERVVMLPHAFDSDKLLRFKDAHAGAARPARAARDEVVIFSPARHDWLDGDPNYSKGNDVLLRGLALITDTDVPWRAVLVAWGRHLDASRELAQSLGIAERIEWVQPLPKRALWARYLESDVVADQFTLPAIGGVTFEAMVLGRRLVTALDLPAAERFFGAAPPVPDCRTPDVVAAALRAVLLDPDDVAGTGRAIQEWFLRYHSAERIVGLQVGAYARIFDRRGLAAASPETTR